MDFEDYLESLVHESLHLEGLVVLQVFGTIQEHYLDMTCVLKM